MFIFLIFTFNVFAIPNSDFRGTDNINLLINPEHNIYTKIENNQISLRFLKSDQSKPSLILVSTSRESIPAVSMVSNVISAGEWIIPNNLTPIAEKSLVKAGG